MGGSDEFSQRIYRPRTVLAERLLIVLMCMLLVSCGGPRTKDGPPRSGSIAGRNLPDDPQPRPEPKSRYGNGPIYEVFGKQYTVLDSSSGYRERGVASWYGKKFHGRLTASREPYDMHSMTAAHKTLPLPTYVRVRNLRNNKSIIVRVNDRGPFVDNRIIDLSYSAALKLEMIRDGTSLVEVEAINFDEPAGDRPTRQTKSAPSPVPVSRPAEPEKSNDVFAQVGAFSDRTNAERRFALLISQGIGNAFIYEDLNSNPTLYRVRVGPISNAVQYDVLIEELERLGIADPYLVTE